MTKIKAAVAIALLCVSTSAIAKSREFSDMERLARRGDMDAEYRIGLAYRTGTDDVRVNPERALDWIRRAAQQGHPGAIALYGLMLYEGDMKEQSEYWLKMAATNGDARSQYVLGLEYWNGGIVEKDPQAAVYFLKRASDQGLEPAQKAYSEVMEILHPAPVIETQVVELDDTLAGRVSGNYYIQLGAFSVQSNATAYWNQIKTQISFGGHEMRIDDQRLHFLRVYGYQAAQARNICNQIKSLGKDCLVNRNKSN